MDQISFFDFLDESQFMTEQEKVFEEILERGSNIQGSIERIMTKINDPDNEFAEFLKKEFGIGGFCYTGYNAWWDSKGIQAGTNFDDRRKYSWAEVAKAFKRKYGRR